MARIPVGNFGNGIADPAPSVRIPQAAFDSGGRGLQQLGDAALKIGDRMAEEQRRLDEEQRRVEKEQAQQNAALRRAEAANTVLDREISVKTVAEDIGQQLADGRITHRDGAEAYRKRIGELPAPSITGMDAVTAENLTRGIKRVDFQGEAAVSRAVDRARVGEFKAQTDGALDRLGKLAGMPGADVEAVTQQIKSLDPLGRVAYGAAWDTKKQEFTDRLWFNEANERAIRARNDLGALRQLETELSTENGFYAGKLDTEKRNTVMRAVIGHRAQLENRLQHQADAAEKRAERTISEIDAQIASGVPATAEMWDRWSRTVRGTRFAEDFNQRISEESRVQEVLRLPIDQQTAFVRRREADLLTTGGSVRDQSNVARLKKAVETNTAQLKDAPLLYAQNRTGQIIPPLDFAALLTPGGEAKLRDGMAERVAIIGALQKQNGPEVKMRPLLPDEAKMLTDALDQLPPDKQVGMFGVLRKSIANDTAYSAVMQQIAPDSPVKARAGEIMAMQRKVTLEKNTFFQDVTGASGDVATTILVGENILNKTRKQKAEDGSGRNPIIPDEAPLRAEFETRINRDVYAGRPAAVERDYQTFKAYYVGAASQRGITQKDPEGALVKQALLATVGEVQSFNGRNVLAPLGMDTSKFHDQVLTGIKTALNGAGRPESADSVYRNATLTQIADGLYALTSGRNFVPGKDGLPLTIRLGVNP